MLRTEWKRGWSEVSARRLRGREAMTGLSLVLWLVGIFVPAVATAAETLPTNGILYTNYHVESIPWSIHVVQFDRSRSMFEIRSAHAGGAALGLSTLSTQVAQVSAPSRIPVAAINGDFYQRDREYAGAPRGLQVTDGELISAPNGGACFWIDVLGEPHATNVIPLFQITWPDGTMSPVGLNEVRQAGRVELYSPAVGRTTRTKGGREFVLERQEGSPWLPLQIGRTYQARVREVRETGNTELNSNVMVLSVSPGDIQKTSKIEKGAVMGLSTATWPGLHGIKTAIGGGPMLVHDRKRLEMNQSKTGTGGNSYEFTSMTERHPRSAIGWDQRSFFLVEVDGRQKGLSVGMTLDELAAFLVRLGCDEAMALDGGGSATLWYAGKVRNSPCDRQERGIANCLIIIRKSPMLPVEMANPRPGGESR